MYIPKIPSLWSSDRVQNKLFALNPSGSVLCMRCKMTVLKVVSVKDYEYRFVLIVSVC